jgi:uncharacterized protein (DUF433 family)
MVMNTAPDREPTSSLSLKEAAVLSGMTEKSIRHELASPVIRAGKTAAGSRRFSPRELLYFCLVAELPIELPRKDRRDLFDLLARGAARRGRWRREAQRLVLEGGVPIILPISNLMKRVEARVALFERGRARVVSRADTLSGEPVFEGTRISVRFVGGRAAREPAADILQDYPALDADDVEFARMFVALGRPRGRPKRLRIVRGAIHPSRTGRK